MKYTQLTLEQKQKLARLLLKDKQVKQIFNSSLFQFADIPTQQRYYHLK